MGDQAVKAKAADGAPEAPQPKGSSPGEPSRPAGKANLNRARRFAEETRGIFEKNREKVSSEGREKIESALQALEVCIGGEPDAKQLAAACRELDARVEQFLGFARKSAAREYTESIIIAVLIAFALRAFVVEAFKIPTGSMIPTLAIGDHIFANKFIYGLRIPFTNSWFAQWSQPQHGDVIVFRYPNDLSKDFIKRVVGVPGDRIRVDGPDVYVNGQRLERAAPSAYQYLDEGEDSITDGVIRRVRAFPEKSLGPDTHEYNVLYKDYEPGRLNIPRPADPPLPGLECTPGTEAEPGECKVLPDFLFVMGDNRDNSSDSRVWGCVPTAFVKGKAMFIWWSRGPQSGVRWDRLGKVVR